MQRSAKGQAGPGCPDCRYFEDDPERLESIFKGLRVFCSAYASVRGDSGLCRVEERFRMPRPACRHYRPKE